MAIHSILEVVKECDSFIHYAEDPSQYAQTLQDYYAFRLADCPSTLGYIPATIVGQISWSPGWWSINHAGRTVTLTAPGPAASRTKLLAQTLRDTIAAVGNTNSLSILRGWRNETFPVYGPCADTGAIDVLVEIERCASALFGIVTYGVQLLCYVRDPATAHGLRLWIARRSSAKQTYPGMLDCTAAGGLPAGKRPIEGVVCEAVEEASLAEDMVRARVVPTGCVSYFHVRGPKAGGETGLLQPEVEYTYEMELEGGMVPRPADDEVEEFRLWGVEEVVAALRRGEFKPNSAVVVVDFLVRHGVLTPENEPDYIEIVTRLHRRLEFPLCAYEV
ncbi:NUDIX hydrolase domain-like protein [Aspergillus ambiguus]|uniref:NUDIX hydrolase domain-like protein n=1 Tax=Aspergillus ambiguus TaxID=176160 RepID=UPI003CCDA402